MIINMKLLLEIDSLKGLEFEDGRRYHTTPWLLSSEDVEVKTFYVRDWSGLPDCLEAANAPFANQKITPIGKNFGSFDKQFIDHLYDDIGFTLRHRNIDVGNLMLLPTDDIPPDLLTSIKRAGIDVDVNVDADTESGHHTAIWDALMCYKIYDIWSQRHDSCSCSTGQNV